MELLNPSKDIIGVLKGNKRLQLKIGALTYLMVSLIFSLLDGRVFSIGWLVTGVFGLALLYKLTPRFFFIGLWLVIVYILIFVGSVLGLKYSEETGSFLILILGIMVIIGAFILVLYMILFIKDRRDQYRVQTGYVPIGLWSIWVMVFFWSSLFSIIGWVRWSDGIGRSSFLNILLYFMADAIMLIAMIYVVSFPEERFKTALSSPPPAESLITGIKVFFATVTGKQLKLDESVRRIDLKEQCPLCSKDLAREIKKCPTCDAPRFFYWCDKTEDHFVRCPNCASLTPIGRDRCIHCSTKIVRKIRCSSCQSVHEMFKWME
jgi:hypothetical protein